MQVLPSGSLVGGGAVWTRPPFDGASKLTQQHESFSLNEEVELVKGLFLLPVIDGIPWLADSTRIF